jgi:hypothetical protein
MTVRWVPVLVIAGTVFYPGRPSTSDRPRPYAHETAALKALQILNVAQVQYNSQFGRFARSLAELGPSVSNLIPADLATGEKRGYKFTMAGTPQGYTIQAVPTVFGSTGSRTFYADQSLVSRENYGREPATANSKEVGSASTKSRRGAP